MSKGITNRYPLSLPLNANEKELHHRALEDWANRLPLAISFCYAQFDAMSLSRNGSPTAVTILPAGSDISDESDNYILEGGSQIVIPEEQDGMYMCHLDLPGFRSAVGSALHYASVTMKINGTGVLSPVCYEESIDATASTKVAIQNVFVYFGFFYPQDVITFETFSVGSAGSDSLSDGWGTCFLMKIGFKG